MSTTDTGHALVTGGARRIGGAIALMLAELGWTVGVHHLQSGEDADTLVRDISDRGGTAYAVAADLSAADGCAGLMAAAADAAGPVTCLVNNASMFERDTAGTATAESWDRHMDTNLRAPFLLSQSMAAALPDGAEGNIVNIADQRVVNIPPGFVSYTVSKAGLWALTQSLALALAPRIRVNAVGPGPTLPSPRQTEAQFALQSSRVPLGHGASPEEIADGVAYILSATSMTGQMIALDGGQHLGWDFPPAGAPDIEE